MHVNFLHVKVCRKINVAGLKTKPCNNFQAEEWFFEHKPAPNQLVTIDKKENEDFFAKRSLPRY